VVSDRLVDKALHLSECGAGSHDNEIGDIWSIC
jgi:hypothetical protein